MKTIFVILISLSASFYNLASAQGEQPFTYVENMPSFPGGIEKMYDYIYDELQYPEDAKQNKISGHVIVQFVVEKDGALNRINVIRGVDDSLNAEAVRVVESMNDGYKWTPGMHNGVKVPVSFTLPIKFVL